MVNGNTRVFVILGDPVEHSMSPAMQTAAFLALGLNAVYVPLRCRADEVPALVRAVSHAGGGGNVTTPHKKVSLESVPRLSPLARMTEACNTFWGPEAGGEPQGDNTDVAGVLAALNDLDAPSTRWLVLGTGGAARAVAAAALQRGAALAVRSRTAERQEAFLAWAQGLGIPTCPVEDCEVAINATPLGLRPGDPLPLEPGTMPGIRVALDLVYGQNDTPWVRAMRGRGIRSADGREMLVAQGAAAFRCWYPGEEAPVEIMRAVVHARLR